MPESDLALLTEAAQQAGEIATRFWKQSPDTWSKPGGAGPVTEADIAVNDALRLFLMAERPDYGWLSEESEDDAKRLDREAVFVIDPIDGTRAFIDGSRTWAHSLAVARGGQIVNAVVSLPMHDKLYSATVGAGATLNGLPIRASAADMLDGATVLAARPTFDAAHWPKGPPNVERHFRSSLAYRLCLVAEGRFDAMVTLRDSWEWDVAAGTLIASEAGVTVSDRDGAALSFNRPGALGPGILAAAPGIAEELLALRRD